MQPARVQGGLSQHGVRRPRLSFGWHYLSNATCLIRPHLLHSTFIVSRITILCQINSPRFKKTLVRQVALDKWFPLNHERFGVTHPETLGWLQLREFGSDEHEPLLCHHAPTSLCIWFSCMRVNNTNTKRKHTKWPLTCVEGKRCGSCRPRDPDVAERSRSLRARGRLHVQPWAQPAIVPW